MLMLEKKVLVPFLTITIYIKEEVIQPLNYYCIFCINVHYVLSFPIFVAGAE